MTKKTEPTSTKIANGIRRAASELIFFAIPGWEPNSKNAHKDIPLPLAILAIVVGLAALGAAIFAIVEFFL